VLRPSDAETALLRDEFHMREEIQRLYDESRDRAQASDWRGHLETAARMLPGLFILESADWIARIYGRMGWSYIRLGEQRKAKTLLQLAEGYDEWQAAANYYWASEYSHRCGEERLADECLRDFRRVCEDLGLPVDSRSDLELAVDFYKRLSNLERSQSSFETKNNQSDLGRYFELRARLKRDPRAFKRAADHYEYAGLLPYAVGCEVFWHLTDALTLERASERKPRYEKALAKMSGAAIFADENIRDLLQGFLEARVLACEAVESAERAAEKPLEAENVEKALGAVYAAVFETPDGTTKSRSLARLAAAVPHLAVTGAWEALIDFVDELSHGICDVSDETPEELTRRLDEAQLFLPSLSFLATNHQEDKEPR